MKTDTKKIYLSFVVPCFNEEANIPALFREIVRLLDVCGGDGGGGGEVIFVDDGSKDGTLGVLRTVADGDSRVRYISFSRNFGKEAAMLAGLQAAQGKFVVMLDADMQHPPTMIPQMLEEITSGEYDCVIAKRSRRGDPFFRTLLSNCFYRLTSMLVDVEMIDGAGDFRLMTASYVEAILKLDERNRFSKGIYPWIGFKTKCVEYENVGRAAGKTKWSIFKLFRYSMNGIIGFSTKMLSLISLLGIMSFATSIVLFVLLILRKIYGNVGVDGWTTIVCLIVFFSGLILLAIGITGQYIEKMYTEIKRRPHFIVRESR
ncbi:MAG: glycosyltransferase family 2 protein [Chitinispirillales bacterium]|jgi:glycosyltransferase involved in cell wall biosynthesis|nr:glycosyltransferase family 2 protein [Chitinispirillales bacterium]